MHSIYKQGELPYLNVKMCPKCEKLVSLSEETCPHCSFSFKANSDVKNFKEDKNDELEKKETLVEEKQENKEAVIESKAKENDLIEEIVEEKPLINPKEKFMFCDNCGAKIIGPQKYCGGCGVKVSKTICPSCLISLGSSSFSSTGFVPKNFKYISSKLAVDSVLGLFNTSSIIPITSTIHKNNATHFTFFSINSFVFIIASDFSTLFYHLTL